MKAKKAVKRLGQAEKLLATVIDRYAPEDGLVRESLLSARASVVNVRDALLPSNPNGQRSPAPRKRPAGGRKRVAPGMKRRASAPTRNLTSVVPRGSLAKSA